MRTRTLENPQVCILAPPLASSVTLGEIFNLAKRRCLLYKYTGNKAEFPKVAVSIKYNSVCDVPVSSMFTSIFINISSFICILKQNC